MNNLSVRVRVKVAMLSLCALNSFGQVVMGCNCDKGPESAVGWLQAHDVVFEARVAEIKTVPVPYSGPPGAYVERYDVVFDVSVSWKGSVSKHQVIRSGGPFNSCTFKFTPGAHYLVYARKDEWGSPLGTSACSPNKSLSLAKHELRIFRSKKYGGEIQEK